MSFCINPQCPNPQNPDAVNFCQSCGSPLVLERRYRVMREMGKGGFAKTYEVTDGGTRKVLKVLHLNEAKPVSLFQQEARVLGQLNHSGIPKGDGYFTVSRRNASEPLHCLVMEYVEGQDLRQWLQSRGNRPIESDRAIAWLSELAAILHQVHQKNFFHRDIKPSNIMLKPDGHLALIDFGAARQVSRTYLQKVKGGMPVTGIISAGYTAPEQAIGKAVPQSDFFALGRTFVYLLTGKEPTAFAEHPRSGQLQWRDSVTQLAPPLADFIDSLIAFLPADRPQSTGELLQRIAQLDRQSSLPPQSGTLPSSTAATVPVSPQPTRPPSQIRGNSPAYTKWIGAAIVLLLGWMGYNLYQSARSPQPVTEVPASAPGERPNPAQPPTPAPEEPRNTPSPAPEEPRNTPSPVPEEPTPTPSPAPEEPTPTPTPAPQPSPTPEPEPPTPTREPNIVLANRFSGHSEAVETVAIAGSEIIATGSRDQTIKLWDVRNGELLRPLDGHKGWIWSLAIAPDDRTLASASADGRIKLWNLQSKQLQNTLYGHRDQVHSVAFSPDGTKLASGSGGVIKENAIKLWDVSTGEELRSLKGHGGTVLTLAYHPNGQAIASGSADNTIKIWDANTGEERQTLTGSSSYIRSLAYTPDGETLVSSSSTRVNVWDAASGSLTDTLEGHRREVTAIAVSSDGTTIASASRDRTVKLWNVQTGKLISTLSAENPLRSVAFGADGNTVVAGSDRGTITIWQLQ